MIRRTRPAANDDLVLEAEVRADWEERAVRELMQEQLDQYEEDDAARQRPRGVRSQAEAGEPLPGAVDPRDARPGTRRVAQSAPARARRLGLPVHILECAEGVEPGVHGSGD